MEKPCTSSMYHDVVGNLSVSREIEPLTTCVHIHHRHSRRNEGDCALPWQRHVGTWVGPAGRRVVKARQRH